MLHLNVVNSYQKVIITYQLDSEISWEKYGWAHSSRTPLLLQSAPQQTTQPKLRISVSSELNGVAIIEPQLRHC